MKSPMMLGIAALDPARDLKAPGRPDDDALAAILGSSRAAIPIRRSPRRAVLAGAAAAAVVAVATVATVTSLGTPTAFAGWSAVPTVLSDEEMTARAASCETSAHTITDGADGPQVEDVPIGPVLAEERGEYTYVLLTGDGAVGECLVVAQASGATEVVTGDTVLGAPPAAPGPRDVTTLQAGTASWSQGATGDGALTSAFGRAGAEVAAVELTLTSGERVEATVHDGWWAVWAPGEASLRTTAELRFTDGATADAEVAVDR
ncbi:hypothetical protein [Krasilnikoviella flava]|uniref:Uncharacterized protein n=1 Tax=Krasilnikoviella flava TaxID=526729 RepID=A0A1T5M1A8_9MICO|nr:hypothetical protein [Krasilnikoviella flava]SKC81588.1 hypothetical protein SAMN04324258_4259 [Krasilnikoviella flava]